MVAIDVVEAVAQLSTLVESLELGRESEIILTRNGMPVAKLMPFPAPKRVGAARHILAGLNLPKTVDEFNAGDEDLADLFR
ncbi:antitoxin [Phyllobacterium sp. OV277]|uniref:type II toxin-antitoxin system Phd/YefM family antitoxin n=1 Tax=Phyllobacterium sp. OV277 TaxID=1882772 RepID=UPI00088BC77F|nr:antitoxin [Phyllobacterium sp. OV277]SDO15092.1 Antitoxin component of toxin-antitoxin stability system, DNA-binding transcriptional repressor [Phyllobacterium sp. OV277]